jgi:hypothetical protein
VVTDPPEKLVLIDHASAQIDQNIRQFCFFCLVQLVSVYVEKYCQCERGSPLVSVNEWLALSQKEGVRGSLLWYRWIGVFPEDRLIGLHGCGRQLMIRANALTPAIPESEGQLVKLDQVIDR